MIENKNSSDKGSFVSHLTELRSRLMSTFLFLLVTFVVCYIFSEQIYSFLVKPYSDAIIENQ